MKNSRLAVFAASLLVAFPVLGQPVKVRLAQNLSPISGIAIVARQKGFFEKQGLDVTVSNFTSGRAALESVMGGGADIATTAEAPTTAAAMAKQKIAFLTRINYSDLKTLTDVADNIGRLPDLKGKKIAYTAGTGSEVYTMTMLKQGGLAKGDVTLVNLRPQDMAPAMSAGSIDVMNTWEPHIANAKKALTGKVRELDTRGIYAETFNIVTTQDYLAARKEPVAAFLRGLIEAEKWMKANREDAIAVVADTVGMKREELAPLWNDFIYEVVLDQKTLDVLKAHAQWRLETGNAPTGATMPDFSQVIFAGPLKSIAPDRVRVPGL